MAPFPDDNNKSPEKEDKNVKVEACPAEGGIVALPEQEAKPDEKEVVTLDEGQLKALLEEAITYKNPKDREGKSELFKELLQEAEADETQAKGLATSGLSKLPRTYLPQKKRCRPPNKECGGIGVSTSRGGSLQNLNALGMDGGSRAQRNRRSGRETLVSARQREGGSLPSDVNTDAVEQRSLEFNFTSSATLQVNEAPPLLQSLGHPIETDSYTSNINLDSDKDYSIQCLSQGESRFLPQQQHVSMLSIPPSQLNSNSDEPNMTLAQAVFQEPDDEVHQSSTAFIGLPFSDEWRRYSSCTFLDFRELSRYPTISKPPAEIKAKSCDENGNSLPAKSIESSTPQDKKKARKSNKAKNERKSRDFKAEEIEGHRGTDEIDSLCEYIQGAKANKQPRSHVKVRAKDNESRPVKHSKGKLNRCTSLEEVSKTKLEDLMEEGSSEKGSSSTLTKVNLKTENDTIQMVNEPSPTVAQISEKVDTSKSHSPQDVIQDSEFLLVKKKHKKKKRHPTQQKTKMTNKPTFSAHDRALPYRHRSVKNSPPQQRRKSASSMPQSEKSESSDLDSVHSLPVSSTKNESKPSDSCESPSQASASYADIAKTASPSQDEREKSSPESRNEFKSHLAFSVTKKDAMTDTSCDNINVFNKEYPPLEPSVLQITTEVRPEGLMYRISKPKQTKKSFNTDNVNLNDKVPEIVSTQTDKYCTRPAVILINEPPKPPASEITFGFEVNQQLLSSSQSTTTSKDNRQMLPLNTTEVIGFVQKAWDCVMNEVESGKARYYK